MNKVQIHKTAFVDSKSEILGEVKIGKNCVIKNSRIINSCIGNNVKIYDSVIEDSKIKDNVMVGPFAHIRPGSVIESNVKIGNFVEIKNSFVGKRTKIPHLSYVGDAVIGEDTNIGCGVIFCNYDGINKSTSYVGNKVFIGSNCNIIAPAILEDESFVAAGTTVTSNVGKNEFCIGRVKNEIKTGVNNLYLQNFAEKPKYFGTDGIRGIYGEKITEELATKVGYSLTRLVKNPKILIAKDTRPSGVSLAKSLASGATSGGAKVYDAGIVSTAGLAYLGKLFNFDFAVMITASHNPSEYNGIKIFDKNGYKINENQENLIEKHLFLPKTTKIQDIKKIDPVAYFEHLKAICKHNLKGIKVFLDCSNGAVSGYAKSVFEDIGASVVAINTSGEINKDASVLDKNLFIQNMQKSNCDIGFCFDGDADRVMCITKNGIVLDGDKILYILARFKKQKYAVGTIMSNMAIEKALKNVGCTLVRTFVGDKYIARTMKSKKYTIGAEESGHVIISDLSTTGDGLVTALYLMNIFVRWPDLFNTAEKLNLYFVKSLKYCTNNFDIIKNKDFVSKINDIQQNIKPNGRAIVRPSGTEPVIRITVEHKDEKVAGSIAEQIFDLLKQYE